MSEKKMLIEVVKDNNDKQATYREQMGKYKRALNNEFYFEAMLIVYAVLEDRLKSFLYHIGAFRRIEDQKLNVGKTKTIIRRLYFGSDTEATGKKLDLNKISAKEDLIRKTISWVLECESIPEEEYLRLLKKEYESCLDLDGLLTTMDKIDEWRLYRNEIIHGLLNKSTSSVNSELMGRVREGMAYARFIDGQVKLLKKKDNIRKKMRIHR